MLLPSTGFYTHPCQAIRYPAVEVPYVGYLSRISGWIKSQQPYMFGGALG